MECRKKWKVSIPTSFHHSSFQNLDTVDTVLFVHIKDKSGFPHDKHFIVQSLKVQLKQIFFSLPVNSNCWDNRKITKENENLWKFGQSVRCCTLFFPYSLAESLRSYAICLTFCWETFPEGTLWPENEKSAAALPSQFSLFPPYAEFI